MKCTEARPLLVELLYGELEPRPESELRSHLETCPSCRDEWQTLGGTRRVLGHAVSQDRASQATKTTLDVASIHQAAASRDRASRRRWRTAALLAATAAAMLLGAFLGGLRGEIHPTHIVVGWGEPPKKVEPLEEPVAPEEPADELHQLLAEHGQRIARLDELLHVVSAELLSNEKQRASEYDELCDSVASLHEQFTTDLGDMQKQNDQRWQLILNEFSRIAADTEVAELHSIQPHAE